MSTADECPGRLARARSPNRNCERLANREQGEEGMIQASRTFAGHLKQFSRAVDIVDKDTFDQVRDLIIRYVRRELGEGAYFDLLREQRIGHELVLQTFWSSEDKVQQLRIPAQDTPATISFHQSKPLWVISGDQTPLDRSNSHQDQWSELSLTDLPPYS